LGRPGRGTLLIACDREIKKAGASRPFLRALTAKTNRLPSVGRTMDVTETLTIMVKDM
jgi:hypothetical protein